MSSFFDGLLDCQRKDENERDILSQLIALVWALEFVCYEYQDRICR